MDNKSNIKAVAIGGTIIAIAVVLGFFIAPSIQKTFNKMEYELEKVDEETDYETLKTVEDTCRAYIASYEADKITYDTNKMLDSLQAMELANAAKTRANRTAAVYNTYYLQNSYVWKDNVPADIKAELPYIE